MIARIVAERANHKVPYATSCRALGVSESWFYKWRNHPLTPTEQRRDLLDEEIAKVFEDQDGEYGSPRVHAELIEQPEWACLSVNTVAERMAALNLRACRKRRRRSLIKPDPKAFKFPNLLERQF